MDHRRTAHDHRTMTDIRDMNTLAVRDSMDVVKQVQATDLTRPTPCAGWTLADLLGHMTVQHRGFAAAARGDGAELAHKALAADFRNIDPTSARIVLVEAGPRILAAFPESLAKKAHKALNRLGVEIRTGVAVEAIDDNGVVIAGKPLAARTVIWTAGVTASLAGKWLGAETDRAGRVEVPGTHQTISRR